MTETKGLVYLNKKAAKEVIPHAQTVPGTNSTESIPEIGKLIDVVEVRTAINYEGIDDIPVEIIRVTQADQLFFRKTLTEVKTAIAPAERMTFEALKSDNAGREVETYNTSLGRIARFLNLSPEQVLERAQAGISASSPEPGIDLHIEMASAYIEVEANEIDQSSPVAETTALELRSQMPAVLTGERNAAKGRIHVMAVVTAELMEAVKKGLIEASEEPVNIESFKKTPEQIAA